MSLLDLGTEGPAAPPRDNGELVFDAPWQSRTFAMVLSLAEQGVFTLDEFREHLIAAIARSEANAVDQETYSYYERWHEALESIVAVFELVPTTAVADRVSEFGARATGHDHG